MLQNYLIIMWHNKISFTLPNKGIFGLLGTNGAGKTTLIGIILGLIDTTQGDVFVFEKNYQSLDTIF